MDEALLDPDTHVGYRIGSVRVAVVGDASSGGSRRLVLSPHGVALHMSHSACRFAMTRTRSTFTHALGIGGECALGPLGSGYSFAAGDVRSNELELRFLRSTQGLGFFDLTVPEGSPAAAVVQQARIFAQIYQMPMGWINGNSPASETCVHELGVFPQLEGLFRRGLPPPPRGGGAAFAWRALGRDGIGRHTRLHQLHSRAERLRQRALQPALGGDRWERLELRRHHRPVTANHPGRVLLRLKLERHRVGDSMDAAARAGHELHAWHNAGR